MVVTRRNDGTVRFVIKPRAGSRQVQLAGDFTDWRPIPMRRQAGDRFVAVIPLAAGRYEYKFIIDGHWQADPAHRRRSLNTYGTVHSLCEVV